MNTPPVNFGIVIASATSLASSNLRTSGDTFGSFALELNTLWHCTPEVGTNSKCSPSIKVEKAQGRIGEEDSSNAGGGIPSPLVTHRPEGQTDKSGNVPTCATSDASKAGDLEHSVAGEALHLASQNKGTPDGPSSVSTAEGAPFAFAEVTEEADLSQSQGDSAEQKAEAQVIANPAEDLFNKLGAELSADPKLSQVSTVQPQVSVDGNADLSPGNPDATSSSSPGMSLNSLVAGAPGVFRAVVAHIENSLDQAQDGGQGQDNDGNIDLTPRALTGDAAAAREATVPQAHPSSSAPFHSPTSDKSENSASAGSSPDNSEAPSAQGSIQPARFVWTQAGGDSGSTSDETSQNSQQGYSTDQSLDSSNNAAFPSAVQKAGPPSSDTGSEMTAGLAQVVGPDSDAQGVPVTSSADSTSHAAPALQNWDSVMERLAQNVSSAHLTDAMGQSEIQVDMKSESWGPVSVRATLSNGQVGAEIQVSDRDAHAVLTEGIHTLEKSLGENGIQLSNLDISHGLGYGHSQSHSQQQKHAGQPTGAARTYAYRSAFSAEPAAVSKTANTTDDFVLGRVSVRV